MVKKYFLLRKNKVESWQEIYEGTKKQIKRYVDYLNSSGKDQAYYFKEIEISDVTNDILEYFDYTDDDIRHLEETHLKQYCYSFCHYDLDDESFTEILS